MESSVTALEELGFQRLRVGAGSDAMGRSIAFVLF